jgi:hypothetical protein
MTNFSGLLRNSLPIIALCLVLHASVAVGTTFSTPQNNTSGIVEVNNTVTIPAVCNDDEKCLPQIYVSIPVNETQIKGMSPDNLNKLKDSYIESLDAYIGESLSAIKIAPRGPIKSSDYCDTLPDPGCRGITRPPPERFAIGD